MIVILPLCSFTSSAAFFWIYQSTNTWEFFLFVISLHYYNEKSFAQILAVQTSTSPSGELSDRDEGTWHFHSRCLLLLTVKEKEGSDSIFLTKSFVFCDYLRFQRRTILRNNCCLSALYICVEGLHLL